ncbi:MAG: outer membrane protein assembly factor BamD [Candidatus Neomarinimicrobiota bacterium]
MKFSKFLGTFLLIFVGTLAVSCGKRSDSPDGLLEAAKADIGESKYGDAIESLRKLVKVHPGHPAAAEAQYMLGDTFIAYAKDFEQAVKEYRTVVSSYPESHFSVNAQFMLGYVYANFIEDLVMARQEYERFLELYSDRADSGLVQSVQFELENLGKDLNEIPRLRHITS